MSEQLVEHLSKDENVALPEPTLYNILFSKNLELNSNIGIEFCNDSCANIGHLVLSLPRLRLQSLSS